jgi:hypothetical protein
MRTAREVESVLALAAEGLNHCEISRCTGIPRTTVRNWVTGTRMPGVPVRQAAGVACSACGHAPHDFAALPGVEYAYLLGLYLGDGTISAHRRGVFVLRIALDAKYPRIIEGCEAAMAAVLPQNKVYSATRLWNGRPSCVEVGASSKQWPCLFPQRGPGMKHTRPIFLAEWQEAICMEHTEPFLRGLIHSDGCRAINTVTSRHGKTYSYPRYQFTNASCDIRDIFYAACRHIGVEARRMNARTISIAKREHVARLDEFIGPKT